MKLIITRHGQTEWNKEGENRLQGRKDIELSEEGKEQAKKLACKQPPITDGWHLISY